MLQINILKNNVITNSAQLSDQTTADAWIASQQAVNAFGKNARVVRVYQNMIESEDVSNATSSQTGIDEQGISYTDYSLPADYTVEQVDITAQINQDQINQDALAYLASTDWMVLRAVDNPEKPVPADVVIARQVARDKIVR